MLFSIGKDPSNLSFIQRNERFQISLAVRNCETEISIQLEKPLKPVEHALLQKFESVLFTKSFETTLMEIIQGRIHQNYFQYILLTLD